MSEKKKTDVSGDRGELGANDIVILISDTRCKLSALSMMMRHMLEEGSVPCDSIQRGIELLFDNIEQGLKDAEDRLIPLC